MHAHVATARVERKSVSVYSVVGKSVVNVVILTYTQYNTSTDHIRIVAVYVDSHLLAGASQPTASLKYVIRTEIESSYPPLYIYGSWIHAGVSTTTIIVYMFLGVVKDVIYKYTVFGVATSRWSNPIRYSI